MAWKPWSERKTQRSLWDKINDAVDNVVLPGMVTEKIEWQAETEARRYNADVQVYNAQEAVVEAQRLLLEAQTRLCLTMVESQTVIQLANMQAGNRLLFTQAWSIKFRAMIGQLPEHEIARWLPVAQHVDTLLAQGMQQLTGSFNRNNAALPDTDPSSFLPTQPLTQIAQREANILSSMNQDNARARLQSFQQELSEHFDPDTARAATDQTLRNMNGRW